MECLLLPENAKGSPVKVPYFGKCHYNGEDWLYYPQHCGLLEYSPDPYNIEEVRSYIQQLLRVVKDRNSFFQTWLYFGLISEMLGGNTIQGPDIAGGQENVPDRQSIISSIYENMLYTDASGTFVTTETLLTILEKAWNPPSGNRDYIARRVLQLHKCGSYASIAFHGLNKGFDQDVRYSIGVIGELISHSTSAAFSRLKLAQRPLSFWWSNEYYLLPGIKSRMLSNGWCPSDIARIEHKFRSIQTLYFLSYLDRTSPARDHSSCTTADCQAYQINAEDYVVGHVSESCDCEQVGVDDDRVISILDDGEHIPLLQVSSGGSKVEINVLKSGPDTKYIAISHVWADGLGNPTQNSVNGCQMLQLHSLLQKISLSQGDEQTLPFWLDTLACPIRPKRSKELAISKIRHVYKRAECVLVLDKSLQGYPSKGVDAVELLLRILTCGWMRRLWTLQEAALSSRLLFQFADRAISLNEVLSQLRSTLDHLLPRLVHLDTWEELKALFTFFYPEKLGLQDVDMQDLDRSLLYRSVSVPSDEPLCIATLMSLSLTEVQAASLTERMPLVWKLLSENQDGLPATIIFSEDPRLRVPGYRWAPASFLYTNPSIHGPGYRHGRWYDPHNRKGYARQKGLEVKFPAFEIVPRLYSDGRPKNPWPGLPRLPESHVLFRDEQTLEFLHFAYTEWGVLSKHWTDEEREAHNAHALFPLQDLIESDTSQAILLVNEVDHHAVSRSNGCKGILTTRAQKSDDDQEAVTPVETRYCVLVSYVKPEETKVLNIIETLAWKLRYDPLTDSLLALDDSESVKRDSIINELKQKMKDMMSDAMARDLELASTIDSLWDEPDMSESIWIMIGNWFYGDNVGRRLPDGHSFLVD